MIYCDTSFLFSLYVKDSGSQQASKQVANAKEPLVWTAWHQLEFTAALEARVGRKANSRREADVVFSTLQSHLENDGFYARRTMDWELTLAKAIDLSREWGALFACRSLDVLHVGICLELGITQFWSLDKRQQDLAKVAGLRTSAR
jgi:predicted nucleic acid-binding protein